MITTRAGDEIRFDVDIASTQQQRTRGLMGVSSVPDGYGMVFLFPATHRGPFHMKDTLVPLDIAFWDESSRIVSVLQMHPCRAEPCETYRPDADYIGAVEVRAGLLDEAGVKVNDEVRLLRVTPDAAAGISKVPVMGRN